MSEIEQQAVAAGFHALTDWAAEIRADEIPDAVLARAARILADDLCAIVAARFEPEVDRFHRRVLSETRPAEATVFRGGRSRTDRLTAAVANAVAADWLELDEGYRKTPCHAGLYIVPALLAEAECGNVDIGTLLRSLAVAYEIVTRVARGWTPANLAHQAHGRYGALGAAAAVALLRGKRAAELRDVLSAAATLSLAGPRSHLVGGALVRNVWPAVGAWSGMMCVTWAECGIAGMANSLHDVFTGVLGGTAQPAELTADLGASWAVFDGYTKIYACCQQTHAGVEASLAARGALPATATPDSIAAITIETHPFARMLINRAPATTLAGKFSLPHVVAVAMATGEAGAEAFGAAMLDDPRVVRLRACVDIKPYEPVPPPPDDRPARVTVTLRDGQRITRECRSAQGGPDRPFSASVIDDKIAAMIAPAYPRFSEAFAAVARLEPRALAQGWSGFVAGFAS